jgi:hypothetical protein
MFQTYLSAIFSSTDMWLVWPLLDNNPFLHTKSCIYNTYKASVSPGPIKNSLRSALIPGYVDER